MIKALEEAEADGDAGDAATRSARRIEREVRARVAIDGVADRKKAKKAKQQQGDKPADAAEKESA